MQTQNRLLQTRLQHVQEDERREMAGDLHDEVAPFLFAVSADASLIRRFAQEGNIDAVGSRADCILGSVGHMQEHLRRVLSRLMPEVLLDLGLAGAIDSLVHFWQSRHAEMTFAVDVAEDGIDARSCAVVFRIVQKSLSNAMRHANATPVDIAVKQTRIGIEVDVIDDGRGLLNPFIVDHERGPGLGPARGLLGMGERVRSVGGVLRVGDRSDRSGVHVHITPPQQAEAPFE